PVKALIEYKDAESSGKFLIDASNSKSLENLKSLSKIHHEKVKREAHLIAASFANLKNSSVDTLQSILSEKVRSLR
ncbi:MAG: hypothetical protein KDD56_09405, partial [Bdellovibrionales bacterium]|nr:hypothetical protein [Bdellovibrionales bacterium]